MNSALKYWGGYKVFWRLNRSELRLCLEADHHEFVPPCMFLHLRILAFRLNWIPIIILVLLEHLIDE